MQLQKSILFILCCLNTLQSQAQDTLVKPNYIPIIANWSLGDTLQYQRIKGVKKFENGQVKDSTATTTKITLVVVDSTASTYVIRIFEDTDLTILQSLDLSTSDWDSLKTIFEGMYLEYETTELGAFRGFRNREKMYQGFSFLFERLIKKHMKGLTPEQQLRFAELMQVRKTQNFFEAKLSEDLSIMHKFYGLSYALDSTWHFEQTISNPLDTAIKFQIPNTLLTSMPEDWNGLVRLENEVFITDEPALSMIRSAVGEKMFEKVRETYVLNPPRYEGYTSYAFYPGDGFLESMRTELNTYLGEQLLSQTFIEFWLQ